MSTLVTDAGFIIHETPLERLEVNQTSVLASFDTRSNGRISVQFKPFQAMKIITIDCYHIEKILVNDKFTRCLLEVRPSLWIEELRSVLSNKDRFANFLDKAHHYILPFQDNILEVVSWEYEVIRT